MTKLHPEAFCQRCRRPNVWSWHAPSPLWNRVMRNSVTGEDRYSVVCPPCFAELAATLIGDVTWCFKPHDVEVRALWKDGDGREWDAEQCLWVAA